MEKSIIVFLTKMEKMPKCFKCDMKCFGCDLIKEAKFNDMREAYVFKHRDCPLREVPSGVFDINKEVKR